jgi:hypothetical protein
VNLFEAISGLSVVVGAIGGAVEGFVKFGILGAVVGLPVGAVLGWVVIFAGPILLLAGVFAVGVWIKDGRPAARRFLWGRGDDPPTDTTSSAG